MRFFTFPAERVPVFNHYFHWTETGGCYSRWWDDVHLPCHQA